MCFGGIFDFATKKERLAEVELELAEPSVWDDPDRAQSLGRERASLELVVHLSLIHISEPTRPY